MRYIALCILLIMASACEVPMRRDSHYAKTESSLPPQVELICIDGYKFAVYFSSYSKDIVQIFHWHDFYNTPIPARCEKRMEESIVTPPAPSWREYARWSGWMGRSGNCPGMAKGSRGGISHVP